MKGKERRYFLLAGILCCMTFIGYSSRVHGTSDGPASRREEYMALGVPFSPWFESWETLENGRVIGSEWRVNPLSWTWPVFFAGMAALAYWRRSRPRPDSPNEPS